jgi:hypothetical protein
VPRRRRIVWIACLIAGAVSVGLTLLFLRSPEALSALTVGGNVKSVALAKTVHIATDEMPARKSSALPTPVTVGPSGNAAFAPAADDRSACGLDQIKSTVYTGKLPADIVARGRSVIEKVTSQLQASRIEQERSLALVLLATQRGRAAFDQYASTRPGCAVDIDCHPSARAASLQAALPHVDALAKMAATTTDPTSYALAFYQCRNVSTAACTSITAGKWATLDPSNAVPWLFVAIAAAANNDAVGRDAALLRAASVPLYDMRLPRVLRLAQNDLVLAELAPVRIAISLDLVGNFMAYQVPGYEQILAFCEPPRAALPGRLESCGRLAEQILQQDELLMGRMLGTRVAALAHWPADRIAALDEEFNAMMRVAQTTDPYPKLLTSCHNFEKFETWIAEVGRHGEVGVLRQGIGASGKTIAALVEERRVAQKKLLDQAERDNAKK